MSEPKEQADFNQYPWYVTYRAKSGKRSGGMGGEIEAKAPKGYLPQ